MTALGEYSVRGKGRTFPPTSRCKTALNNAGPLSYFLWGQSHNFAWFLPFFFFFPAIKLLQTKDITLVFVKMWVAIKLYDLTGEEQ